MRKVLSSFFALAMLTSCTISAFAFDDAYNSDSQNYVVGEAIGKHSEEDGFMIDSGDTKANGLPFSMTAKSVSNLLTTYSSSGKNFTGGVFDTSDGLLVEGKLTHTSGNGINIKVGACYYKSIDNTFYSVYPLYFESGKSQEGWIPKLPYFSNSMTYYGYMKNTSGIGKISGTLNFSVSKDPM